jgi:hypothetical protein
MLGEETGPDVDVNSRPFREFSPGEIDNRSCTVKKKNNAR